MDKTFIRTQPNGGIMFPYILARPTDDIAWVLFGIGAFVLITLYMLIRHPGHVWENPGQGVIIFLCCVVVGPLTFGVLAALVLIMPLRQALLGSLGVRRTYHYRPEPDWLLENDRFK